MDRRHYLQRMGMKPTATRIEILRLLQEVASVPGVWTMPELMRTMLQKDLSISQSTLTNVLNAFNNKHLISRHVDNKGVVTYRISNISSWHDLSYSNYVMLTGDSLPKN